MMLVVIEYQMGVAILGNLVCIIKSDSIDVGLFQNLSSHRFFTIDNTSVYVQEQQCHGRRSDLVSLAQRSSPPSIDQYLQKHFDFYQRNHWNRMWTFPHLGLMLQTPKLSLKSGQDITGENTISEFLGELQEKFNWTPELRAETHEWLSRSSKFISNPEDVYVRQQFMSS